MTLKHTAPFLRLLLPYAMGIYAGLQLRHDAGLQLAWMVVSCCTGIITIGCGISLWKLYRGGSVPSALSHLLLLSTGFLSALSSNTIAYSNHYSKFATAPELLLRIAETPRAGKGFVKCEAAVEALIYPHAQSHCCGTILLYIKQDSGGGKYSWRYGDLLRVTARLQPIPGASYPEAFDYGAMMRERGILHRIFVHEHRMRHAGNRANPLLSLAHEAAAWTGTQLQQHFPRRIAAVLASLLIGLRTDIETQDITAFKNTGTLHVLAVSGMHIALIFQVLMWLTRLLPSAFPPYFRLLLVAAAIWSYAGISGFSASVCRAALMCSIMLLGKALRRESSLANSLCATAFLLLLWEPRWLQDAGFLLSFTAVAGIIAFEPLFAGLWKPGNKLLQHIRNLLSVSCAAQLGTLPVSLYFFHQFASYFLIGNLLIIPLSTIALFGGLFFLAIGHIAVIGPLIQTITITTTSMMLETAGWIGQRPHALLEGCYLNVYEASMLAVFLGGCTWWFYNPGKRKPWLMLFSLFLFMGLYAMRNIQERYLRETLIYSRKGTTWTLLFQQGRNACVLSNDTTAAQRESMRPYLQRYGLKPYLYCWKGTHDWVQINRYTGDKNKQTKHDAGQEWHVRGSSTPADAPGIYVRNKQAKGSDRFTRKSSSAFMILDKVDPDKILQLPDLE